MSDEETTTGVQLAERVSNKNPLAKRGGGGRGNTSASPGAAPSRAVAFKKVSSLLSSFGSSKSDTAGPSKGEGGGKPAATHNADFKRASKVTTSTSDSPPSPPPPGKGGREDDDEDDDLKPSASKEPTPSPLKSTLLKGSGKDTIKDEFRSVWSSPQYLHGTLPMRLLHTQISPLS